MRQAFSIEESRRILVEAQRLGLRSKIHADEIVPLGGAELAGEVGAISAEHLLAATDKGLEALAKSGVIRCCCLAHRSISGYPSMRVPVT